MGVMIRFIFGEEVYSLWVSRFFIVIVSFFRIVMVSLFLFFRERFWRLAEVMTWL